MTEIQNPNGKTKDLIQSALTQAAVPTTAPKQEKMKDLITSTQVRDMFRNALAEHADAFLASVIDLYNTDKNLQTCNPGEVLMECFRAATLKLPINRQLGFCYVLPYKDNRQGGKMVPTFQLGYKGYIQLCMRTGAYRHIHAGPVYEGEFVSENRLTGEIDLSGKKTGDRTIGYSAYIETINGFSKALYWTTEKVGARAKRYSKSYGSISSPWTTNFDEMASKSLLTNLLSKYGIMSVEMQNAFVADIGGAADDQLQNVSEAIEAEVAGSEVPAADVA